MYRYTWIISAPDSHMCSTQQHHKTAYVVDVHTRRRVATEFLTVEYSSLVEIHRHLRGPCGEDAINVSSDIGYVVLG
jgi:hypothetical protein